MPAEPGQAGGRLNRRRRALPRSVVAVTASLAGLGALVLAAPTLFTALKWIGAADLIWLGVKLIRAAPNAAITLPETGTITAQHTFTHAATVIALNPKSIAFFIAVFIAVVPQFVAPTAHAPASSPE